MRLILLAFIFILNTAACYQKLDEFVYATVECPTELFDMDRLATEKSRLEREVQTKPELQVELDKVNSDIAIGESLGVRERTEEEKDKL